ncbi:ParB N-terminal domain-containing protein [Streptomyces sp. NPDC001828]|uniref:ParB N-terminal domain-containing protein n=1 Tax=Streptomyces sp. NPDC001828 TaxID=3364615 RepID=UPI0036CFB315
MPKKYAYELPEHRVEHGVCIPVEDLKIDEKAQRVLNEPRARSMANNLVPEALGAIVVSQRTNGDHYIVDGMHRWHVCKLTGIPEIVAEVHHGLDQQEEAILFLIKNRESSKPTPLDEYKIGLTAGIPLFVDTESACESGTLRWVPRGRTWLALWPASFGSPTSMVPRHSSER